MTHPLAFLYETTHIRHAFGQHWCGPDKLPHAEPVAVAHYVATNDDGQAVTVYCSAWPALFFTIYPATGDHQIGTGSGMMAFAIHVAEGMADGSISIEKKNIKQTTCDNNFEAQ